MALEAGAPRPRLCHVKRWSDFNGYGFNLHAEKGKVGQYIGSVDPNSPADLAGLKADDRIIEVNGTNISNENHQQVVQRIKSVPDETVLLVVDREADEYYRNRRIIVRSDQENVQRIESPSQKPGAVVQSNDDIDGPSPRLCILRIWPHFQGYGFNLHAEKGHPGQYIGQVDGSSPAEAAHLLSNDRLIEVNGINVQDFSHAQTVSTIKKEPNLVKLLVIEPEGKAFYDARNITISSAMPNIKVYDCDDGQNKEEVTEAAVAVAVVVNDRSSDKSSKRSSISSSDIEERREEIVEKLEERQEELEEEREELEEQKEELEEQKEALEEQREFFEENRDSLSPAEAVVIEQRIEQLEDEVEEKIEQVEDQIEENQKEDEKIEVITEVLKDASVEDSPAEVAVAVVAATQEDGPELRLCRLRKWSDFNGYGFNLHAEASKAGHYIGSSDVGSPAHYAGLLKGDLIIEVNGESIQGDKHGEVVKKIKAHDNFVNMLVGDEDSVKYYNLRDIPLSSSLRNVRIIEGPEHNPEQKKEEETRAGIAVSAVIATKDEDADRPALRLCKVKKWLDFQGYGFNLRAEKSRQGNFIGSVDEESPASLAGLKTGDKIVAVNGSSVVGEDHTAVVSKIKQNPRIVELLVADLEAAQYYEDRNILMHGEMDIVQVIEGPEHNPNAKRGGLPSD